MYITIWRFVAGLAITNWNIALWISIDHFHFNDSLQWQQIGGWFRPEVCVYLFLLFSFWKSTRFFLCPLLHPNHGNSNWKLTYSWNTGKWSWQHCWKIYRLWICNISDDNYRETGKKKELRENRKKNWTKKNSNVYLFFGLGGVNVCMWMYV